MKTIRILRLSQHLVAAEATRLKPHRNQWPLQAPATVLNLPLLVAALALSVAMEVAVAQTTGLVAPNVPAHDATNVSRSAVLSATIAPANQGSVNLTFYGRAVPTRGRDFTVVVLPDAQNYTGASQGGSPDIFVAQTDWIVANRVARNIAFVAQLGDVSKSGDNNGDDTEWRNATNALYRLENPATTFLPEGIPYGVAVGNRDQFPKSDPHGTTTFFNRYFGEERFRAKSYYGGHYGANNNNYFAFFSASGLDFIVVFLEYDPAPDAPVLAWANSVLQTHRQRRAIIVSHQLLNADKPPGFQEQGQVVYDALKGNANLFLLLCGHSTGEAMRQDTYNGNKVYSVLSDYQTHNRGGNGWLRLLEFSPGNNVIRVSTYSPSKGEKETDNDSQFLLDYDLQPSGEFTAIARLPNVATGVPATALWPNLNAFTEYEWYVAVSNGVTAAESPRWRFTTSDQVFPALSVTTPASHSLFSMQISGEPGGQYQIEASSDLVQWSSQGRVLTNTSGLMEFSDPVGLLLTVSIVSGMVVQLAGIL